MNLQQLRTSMVLIGFVMVLLTTTTTYGQQSATGDLSVVGEVTVNGVKVESGDIALSGSRIHTAKGSSAVVSLGKLGRVELTEGTTMFLTYDDTSIGIKLSSGAVVIGALLDATVNVTTREGVVISDGSAETTFKVDAECGNTIVTTLTGEAHLRSGGTVTPVPAGGEASAGKPQGRCRAR